MSRRALELVLAPAKSTRSSGCAVQLICSGARVPQIGECCFLAPVAGLAEPICSKFVKELAVQAGDRHSNTRFTPRDAIPWVHQ